MKRTFLILLAIFLLFSIGLIKADCLLEAGTLTLNIYISKTAHLFHIVDQISQWSPFCHKQYLSYFQKIKGIDEQDSKFLNQHRAIRKTHGWSKGLEQTFYTNLDLDDAIDQGIKEGYLTREEAQTEREILMHFKSHVEQLMQKEAATLDHFVQELLSKRSEIASLSNDISLFVGGAKLSIPFYPIANPHEKNSGGGFNGGKLTLEISKNRDMLPILLHEVFHAFLNTKKDIIDKVACSTPDLDIETLHEGIAYAYTGLMYSGKSGEKDRLFSKASDYMEKREYLDNAYTRFNVYGFALRPILKETLLKKHTLEIFLPRATDAWLVLNELDKARCGDQKDYRSDPKHSIFIFGCDRQQMELLADTGSYLFGCSHSHLLYKKMFAKNTKPNDTVILLLSLDSTQRVPKEFHDLLPLSWPEIEILLKQDQVILRQGKSRDMNVYLIAAPTKEKLQIEYHRLVSEKKITSIDK